MKHLYYFLTIALCAVVIYSCEKKEKNLTLQGIWNEEVSTAYDTINHSKIRAFTLKCDNVFSFVKTTYYLSKGSDSLSYNMLSYDEYVEGAYTVENDKIYFNGYYYADSLYINRADSTNVPLTHNIGQYLDTTSYVIDSKCLMLNLEVQDRQNISRFAQEQVFDDCGWD